MSSQAVLASAVIGLLIIATGAMLLSASANTSTIERLAEQSLINAAFALASAAERVIIEGSANKTKNIRDLLSDRVIAYAMLIDRSGRVIFHSNPALEGTVLEGFVEEGRLLSMNLTGRRVTLQTGTPAYEFNYLLHRERDSHALLRLFLHTYPADNILRQTSHIWWSISGGIALLWSVGIALIFLLIRQSRLINQRRRDEQWAALGRMSAVLAHEIRNAIGSIKGFVQWIDERTDASDTRKSPLSLILKGTAQVEGLVKEMLLYSREEVYKTVPLMLAQVAEEAITQVSLDFKGTMNVDIPKDTMVIADREKLLRAVINVLQNAIQSAGTEGIIDIYTSPVQSDWVGLNIKDNGHGLDPEALQRAFEPFYTTRSRGTGLGLAYCKKVIEGMGGSIEISNNRSGRGAVVVIGLKAAAHGRAV